MQMSKFLKPYLLQEYSLRLFGLIFYELKLINFYFNRGLFKYTYDCFLRTIIIIYALNILIKIVQFLNNVKQFKH